MRARDRTLQYEGNCSIAASEARLILQAREKKGQTDYGIVCT
jgi:hypothetical protein